MDFPEDPTYYELIDGEIVKKAAPAPKHQIVSANFFSALNQFVREKGLGVVLYAPVDVFLDDYNLVQPDVLFLSDAKRSLITNDGIVGAPDLVAEILLPTTAVRDRTSKLKLYERAGIAEYWLTDAQNTTVEVYQLTAKGYELYSAAAVEGTVASALLQGFFVELKALFGFLMSHSKRTCSAIARRIA